MRCNIKAEELKVRDDLIKIYGRTCFLGGIETPKNKLTVHEIIAIKDGGRRTFDNCALICRLEHDILNKILIWDKFFASKINESFKQYKTDMQINTILNMRKKVNEWLEIYGFDVVEKSTCLVLRGRYYY